MRVVRTVARSGTNWSVVQVRVRTALPSSRPLLALDSCDQQSVRQFVETSLKPNYAEMNSPQLNAI